MVAFAPAAVVKLNVERLHEPCLGLLAGTQSIPGGDLSVAAWLHAASCYTT